jgi:hypothetical protein
VYIISLYRDVIETVTNIKTVLRICTQENNVGIVSFNLFGVWWWLSKGIVMISFLININQWLKRSNANNIHSLKFDTSTSLLALVQSEVSSHKATSSPESPSNVSPVNTSDLCETTWKIFYFLPQAHVIDTSLCPNSNLQTPTKIQCMWKGVFHQRSEVFTGLTLEGDSGEEVALWLLTSLCTSAKREVEVAL